MATQQRIVRVGDHLPHISLPTLEGGQVHLKDFHGKKLVLFCWASW